MSLLTYSSATTFHDCQRKYRLTYEEGWRPVKESEALRFGKLIHAALEAWWKARADTRLLMALRPIAAEAIDEIDRIKAEELIAGYDRQWRTETERYKVLSVEAEFRAPMLGPDLTPIDGWEVGGKLDVLLKEGGRVLVLVMEHKTTSEDIGSDADDYWRKLPMDWQLSTYILGSESIGTPAEEAIYDVIKKPDTKYRRATPVEKRKYTKAGVLYANQREHDETPEEFRERLREEIASDPNAYYRRRVVPRLNSELQNFLADARDTAASIDAARERGSWPRNPAACFRFRGNPCPFYAICMDGLDPAESSEFIRYDNPHRELKGEIS